jgi:catechol 2,3-dioxygenase-like lactoylglutathione lyase family enzyme
MTTNVDLKLEVVTIPVADLDRAKEFYAGLGVVSDIDAARDELAKRGVDVGEVFHPTADGLADGPAPEHASYGSLAGFSDPDGNGWVLQEVTTRLPGRVDSGTTTYTSVADLADALRRAAAAHGEHEKRTGEADENWPDWYAEYLVSEQSGTEPPK